MDIATIVFYLFSALLLISAFMVITAKNPVHSVLFLIFAFFNAAGLFILIGAEYIAMTLVIVYVGAVAVLFLFVVMMMDIDIVAMRQGFLKYVPFGAFVAAALFAQFYLLFSVSKSTTMQVAKAQAPVPEGITNAHALGRILYTDYIYAFQLAGVVLLVAMIGAIVLTLRDRKQALKQNINKQLARKREDAVAVVSVKSGEGA